MKHIHTQLLIICIGLFLCLLSACDSTSKYTVSGVVSDAADQTIYFENVGVSNVKLLDSIKLNSLGKFKFSN